MSIMWSLSTKKLSVVVVDCEIFLPQLCVVTGTISVCIWVCVQNKFVYSSHYHMLVTPTVAIWVQL